MDIFFQDPTEVKLPPQEVRLKGLRIEPWADGRRVRVLVEITPFQKRPNLEVVIRSASEEQVAQVSVIEIFSRKLEFNMHLQQDKPGGEYTVRAVLYYDNPIEPKEPPPENPPPPLVVDQLEATFKVEP